MTLCTKKFAKSDETGSSLLETLLGIALIITVALPLVTGTLLFFNGHRYASQQAAHAEAISGIGLAEYRFFTGNSLLDSVYSRKGVHISIQSLLDQNNVTFVVLVAQDSTSTPFYELKLLRGLYE
jgi:hypothetical protein